ncbi:hypothetical protein [Psychroserpens luteolus]|uniref:hypothetical protein n=1 Tax=Psychroserpens luteolus TaxID=2855840 RepID=UPI001E49B065|nr:hypothetical protein [Psychroserpens luteolus]MCD2260988.1 hypothetical protein [Psychroserpens luteolus]
MPKRKNPVVLSSLELEKKDTRELLGYLKRLHQCEESFETSDLTENIDLTNDNIIYFKKTEKWNIAYSKVKSILSTREHLNKKT